MIDNSVFLVISGKWCGTARNLYANIFYLENFLRLNKRLLFFSSCFLRPILLKTSRLYSSRDESNLIIFFQIFFVENIVCFFFLIEISFTDNNEQRQNNLFIP